MKQIVVGVSDQETSHTAARKAFELAERFGATVHVVTAVDAAAPIVIQVGSDSFEVDDIRAAEQAIDAVVRRLGVKADWKPHAVDGKPAKVLVNVAEHVGADLIVVGNVRMQGIGRVLGSVGNDVLQRAPCSVLIVKTA